MNPNAIAKKIRNYVELCSHKSGDQCFCISQISAALAQARAEAYEEGKRDSIIEFCEGDRSMLAEYEQKAYVKGRAEAMEEAAKKVVAIGPSNAQTYFYAECIRALATPPETEEGKDA